jgi:hypothetical protein
MRYRNINSTDWDNTTTTTTYTENNIFFSHDLSQLLRPIINDNNNVSDTDTEKEIPAGTNQEIPFKFTIPAYVLPSYKGKSASITYIIKATADRPKKVDINKELSFRVLNPNYNIILSYDGNNNLSGFGNFSSLFWGKSRDHFTKEGTGAKFDLRGTNKFSRGDTIKGNIMLLDEKAKTKSIKDISIILYGIEHAVAVGHHAITTVEKYESKIKNQPDENTTSPFDIQIPYNANVSYIGRYSEYYWGLEAKINLPWSSDIYARSIVEVVY